MIGIDEDAWDVYFLYDRSAKWTDDLPQKPSFWMHQLGRVMPERHLDPDTYAAQANALLKQR